MKKFINKKWTKNGNGHENGVGYFFQTWRHYSKKDIFLSEKGHQNEKGYTKEKDKKCCRHLDNESASIIRW